MSTFSPDVFDPQTAAPEKAPIADRKATSVAAAVQHHLSGVPPRPAWIEIDLKRLRQNFELINRDKSEGLQILSVVKDEAYGHGAFQVARTANRCGVSFLGLSTLSEAVALRERGIHNRMLL